MGVFLLLFLMGWNLLGWIRLGLFLGCNCLFGFAAGFVWVDLGGWI